MQYLYKTLNFNILNTMEEKELSPEESLRVINRMMKDNVAVRLQPINFINVWGLLSAVIYALTYLVSDVFVYAWPAVPVLSWLTYGITYVQPKKRRKTMNYLERNIYKSWNSITFMTTALMFAFYDSVKNELCLSIFSLCLAIIVAKSFARQSLKEFYPFVNLFLTVMQLINDGETMRLTFHFLFSAILLESVFDDMFSYFQLRKTNKEGGE